MRRLDFLIAGVQKGGTTALWQFLREHPQIRFGSRKEMHYFDNDDLDWSLPNHDMLHAAYGEPEPGVLWGDATPIYTYWPNCLERIAAYNPDIKLIISLRDPVERAYSHWRMEVARFAETLSFSDAIRDGRARMQCAAPHPGFHRVYSYVERGFYLGQLERVLSFFPRKNVMLTSQHQLAGSHDEVLGKICRFLALNAFDILPRPDRVFSFKNEHLFPFQASDRAFLQRLYTPENEDLKRLHCLVWGADNSQAL